jgi:type II secretory pathway component GspD/PulD (secretin)
MRNEQLVQRRIPLLGSIPILGFFFSNTRKIVSNSEVVIIITPRLM